MNTVSVARRFNGPPQSGNGGYSCGVIAAAIGWPISSDGRKHRAGTALFDEDGERCAVGVATRIELKN